MPRKKIQPNRVYVELWKSPIEGKKYRAIFKRNKEEFRHTDFGADGMSDYTIHKDDERKDRYIARHKKNENWYDGYSPGALSRWVLWNKQDLESSWKDYKRRFKFL